MRKVIDGLRPAVLRQLKIVLVQGRNDPSVLVADRGQHADGLDVDRNFRLRLLRPLQFRLRLSLLLCRLLSLRAESSRRPGQEQTCKKTDWEREAGHCV